MVGMRLVAVSASAYGTYSSIELDVVLPVE